MLTRRSLLIALPATLVVASAGRARAAARTGTFTGLSGHVATGTVTVDGRTVTLSDDFTFDNGPDVGLGLGLGDDYDRRTWMGRLDSFEGAQTYTVPERADPADYDTVFIWCRLFGVPLGRAQLA